MKMLLFTISVFPETKGNTIIYTRKKGVNNAQRLMEKREQYTFLN